MDDAVQCVEAGDDVTTTGRSRESAGMRVAMTCKAPRMPAMGFLTSWATTAAIWPRRARNSCSAGASEAFACRDLHSAALMCSSDTAFRGRPKRHDGRIHPVQRAPSFARLRISPRQMRPLAIVVQSSRMNSFGWWPEFRNAVILPGQFLP